MNYLKRLGFITSLCLMVVGCTPESEDNTLSVKFNVNAGSVPLQYNTNYMLDTMAIQFSLVKFYTCQPEISSGDEVHSFPDNYFLGEAEHENIWIIGDIGKHLFDNVSFGYGVDSSRNTINGSKAIPAFSYSVDHPLSAANNMYWAWNPGYIWMKLEGRMDANMDGDVFDSGEIFALHTGLDPAFRILSRTYVFEMNNAPKTIQVDMDILKFLNANNLVNHPFAHPFDTSSVEYPTMLAVQNEYDQVFGNFYE